MKYTICGYSQPGLMEYNLTNDDALLLRVISDIYLSGSAKLDFIVHENDKYMWLTYGYIAKEIPILGTEKTFANKIKALIEKKILKKIVTKSKRGRTGTFMFIAFGENYKNILEYDTHKKEEEREIVSATEEEVSSEQSKTFLGEEEKLSSDQRKKFPDKDPSITNPSIIIKKNNTHSARENVPIVEDILKKYRECNLPEFEFAPKNHVIMECLNTLGAEKLFKAFEMMKESSFVKNNFSINMVFNVENLKKALNGTFKDKIIVKQEKKIASNLGIYHDKEYADNEDYENMMRALGLSD